MNQQMAIMLGALIGGSIGGVAAHQIHKRMVPPPPPPKREEDADLKALEKDLMSGGGMSTISLPIPNQQQQLQAAPPPAAPQPDLIPATLFTPLIEGIIECIQPSKVAKVSQHLTAYTDRLVNLGATTQDVASRLPRIQNTIHITLTADDKIKKYVMPDKMAEFQTQAEALLNKVDEVASELIRQVHDLNK